IVIGVAATAIFGWFFAYYYSKKSQGEGQKPLLDVKISPKEARFKERMTVQNLSQTNYAYRFRVGRTYLTWEQNSKQTLSLAPGTASGVILDSVVNDLPYHDVVIEAIDRSRWPWSKTVYKRRFKDI
ncbi:MAG TPA: hypothetical protein VGQ13_06155, partial [Nitrososphaera sp.]|nr:hypothetical protein [Nitrososphaera sp.]